MSEENQMHQEVQQPTLDQLIFALMWELQALRSSVHELTGVVYGLTNSLKEEE